MTALPIGTSIFKIKAHKGSAPYIELINAGTDYKYFVLRGTSCIRNLAKALNEAADFLDGGLEIKEITVYN